MAESSWLELQLADFPRIQINLHFGRLRLWKILEKKTVRKPLSTFSFHVQKKHRNTTNWVTFSRTTTSYIQNLKNFSFAGSLGKGQKSSTFSRVFSASLDSSLHRCQIPVAQPTEVTGRGATKQQINRAQNTTSNTVLYTVPSELTPVFFWNKPTTWDLGRIKQNQQKVEASVLDENMIILLSKLGQVQHWYFFNCSDVMNQNHITSINLYVHIHLFKQQYAIRNSFSLI